jgi:CheY-like chemotaxis protein
MGSRERVLVVDDDADSREILKLVLGDAGFMVETARDAREALERLRAAQPDLILSDLQMPGMSGLDLIRTLRGRGIPVPVVLLTGADTRDLCTSAAAYGAAACLAKPANLDELIWTVDLALACSQRRGGVRLQGRRNTAYAQQG